MVIEYRKKTKLGKRRLRYYIFQKEGIDIAESPLNKSRLLKEMSIPRRTYYNWVKREKGDKAKDTKGQKRGISEN